MEQQSTGPDIQPLHGVSADPGFIPGIMSPPVPAATPKPGEEDVDDARPAPGEEPVEDARPTAVDPGSGVAAETDADEAEPVVGRAAPGDGPSFEAADRRGRIVADAEGIRLSYDEEACDFRWDEIGAVESETKRFGRRFSVIVHTPGPRWYPIDIVAPDRERLSAWEKELDAVLDAYFDEDGAEDGAEDGDEGENGDA